METEFNQIKWGEEEDLPDLECKNCGHDKFYITKLKENLVQTLCAKCGIHDMIKIKLL